MLDYAVAMAALGRRDHRKEVNQVFMTGGRGSAALVLPETDVTAAWFYR
jgi:hypothetical protein